MSKLLIRAQNDIFKKLLLYNQHSKTKRLIYSDKWPRTTADPHIHEAVKHYWTNESDIKKHQLLHVQAHSCFWFWAAKISNISDRLHFMLWLLVWCIFFCDTWSQTVGDGLKCVLHVFLLAQTKDPFYRSCIAAHTGLLKQTNTTPLHCQSHWMQIGWSRWLDL